LASRIRILSTLSKLVGRGREDDVSTIAKVLASMVLMGIEKRARCTHYDPSTGLCKFLKLRYPLPWMDVVCEGGECLVKVSKHPEVCATCPFWKPIDGGEP